MSGLQAFRAKMTSAGHCPGNPHELIGIQTIRQLVAECWQYTGIRPGDVDGLIRDMARRGIISLHEHDWPARIKLEGRQSEYLWWGADRCFVGAHLRMD